LFVIFALASIGVVFAGVKKLNKRRRHFTRLEL
jgi:hypothetical protein